MRWCKNIWFGCGPCTKHT